MLSATQVWGNFVNERTNLSVLPFSFSHIGVIFPCWKQSFFCEVRKLISIEWRSIICFQHNGYTESGKHLFKFRQYWLRLYWINYFNLRKATIIVNNNYDVFSWQVRPSKICRQLVPWHGRFWEYRYCHFQKISMFKLCSAEGNPLPSCRFLETKHFLVRCLVFTNLCWEPAW